MVLAFHVYAAPPTQCFQNELIKRSYMLSTLRSQVTISVAHCPSMCCLTCYLLLLLTLLFIFLCFTSYPYSLSLFFPYLSPTYRIEIFSSSLLGRPAQVYLTVLFSSLKPMEELTVTSIF